MPRVSTKTAIGLVSGRFGANGLLNARLNEKEHPYGCSQIDYCAIPQPAGAWAALPILNMVVPQVPQVPRVAGRPFFIVTSSALWISLVSLHFMQYPVIATPSLA